ncbi:MAG: ABC transporter substrate-binding protein [Caldilineaceae bacterium]|nr:ABC transporter substrate-binding protein [Caldilineaceae bacterium]
MKNISVLFALTLLLLGGCLPIQPVAMVEPNGAAATAVTTTLPANLTTGCVENFDPTVDYFPDKVTPAYAIGWTVEYYNHYKIVSLPTPWNDATETFQYLLLQCGTPMPDGYADLPMIQVPVQRVITMSSTQLPHLAKLNRLGNLVGHESFQYVNTPAVRALIDAGKLVEVGSGAAVNVEVAIDADPDLILPYSLGNPEQDAHPKLIEAGLPVVLTAEYMETSPLGRVEWVKFMALFFNEEAQANRSFAGTVTRYQAMAQLARAVTEKPTVFTGIPRGDSWYVAGGRSYVAQFLADAGAQYLWADNESTGTSPVAVEAVFDKVYAGDFWFNTSTWTTLDDALAADARLADLAAFQKGQVYNNNARLSENGGNDYWESGLANPDVILADLIKILHPELLPDHELVYYRHLAPSSE